jgi:hypothetical protein
VAEAAAKALMEQQLESAIQVRMIILGEDCHVRGRLLRSVFYPTRGIPSLGPISSQRVVPGAGSCRAGFRG